MVSRKKQQTTNDNITVNSNQDQYSIIDSDQDQTVIEENSDKNENSSYSKKGKGFLNNIQLIQEFL